MPLLLAACNKEILNEILPGSVIACLLGKYFCHQWKLNWWALQKWFIFAKSHENLPPHPLFLPSLNIQVCSKEEVVGRYVDYGGCSQCWVIHESVPYKAGWGPWRQEGNNLPLHCPQHTSPFITTTASCITCLVQVQLGFGDFSPMEWHQQLRSIAFI